MYAGQLVFAQLMDHLPLHTLRRCVARYPSRYPPLSFSHLDQFLAMAFAQLTFRESLRDIETCLRAHATKLYHLGIRESIARSTLADANEKRDGRISRDFALRLIHVARRLYATTVSLWNWRARPMRSTPRRSTCRSRCFPGPAFARPRRPPSCIRCSICEATSRRSSTHLRRPAA